MNSTGLPYPSYSWFSLSALKVSSYKCKLPLFLVFWYRQNKSIWLAKMLIPCAHENVGGIRSFLQIWLHSPETKLSFKNLMKCLALLVAKITMLQFAFCRGYLVSKPGETATEPELGASSLYLKWELGAKQCVRGVGVPQTWRQRKTLLKRGCLKGWSSLDGGVPWDSAISFFLSTPYCSLSLLSWVSPPSPSFRGSFMSPDLHCFSFPHGFMHPGHKYYNN